MQHDRTVRNPPRNRLKLPFHITMQVREYKESDLAQLKAIHASQGFDYAFPDLANPLFVTKFVLTNSDENRTAKLGLTDETRKFSPPHCSASPRKRTSCSIQKQARRATAGNRYSHYTPPPIATPGSAASKTSTHGCHHRSQQNSAAASNASAGSATTHTRRTANDSTHQNMTQRSNEVTTQRQTETYLYNREPKLASRSSSLLHYFIASFTSPFPEVPKMSRGAQAQTQNLTDQQLSSINALNQGFLGQQQQLGGILTPQFQSILNNPGLSPADKSAVTSNSQGSIASAFDSLQQSAANRVARTRNSAGFAALTDDLARQKGVRGRESGRPKSAQLQQHRLPATDGCPARTQRPLRRRLQSPRPHARHSIATSQRPRQRLAPRRLLQRPRQQRRRRSRQHTRRPPRPLPVIVEWCRCNSVTGNGALEPRSLSDRGSFRSQARLMCGRSFTLSALLERHAAPDAANLCRLHFNSQDRQFGAAPFRF